MKLSKQFSIYLLVFPLIIVLQSCDEMKYMISDEVKKEVEKVVDDTIEEIKEEAESTIEEQKDDLLDKTGFGEDITESILLISYQTNNCYEYVRVQREKNGFDMPCKMLGDCGKGLYDGSYISEGRFTDDCNQSFSFGQVPKPGAIMIESPSNSSVPCGHVSIVTEVTYKSNGFPKSFVVSEAEWAGKYHEFVWNNLKQRYTSKDNRFYDCFVY